MTAPEFKHTMKVIVSPGGRMIPAIRASERRTGGKGFTGWQTPSTEDHKSDGPKTMAHYERHIAEGTALPCSAQRLRNQAMALCHWSTPTVQDSANNAGPSQFDRNTHPLNVQATLAAWPTPDSMQGAGGAQDAEKRMAGGHHVRLQDAVTLLAIDAYMAHGPVATSSHAGTGKRGVLRPGHSRWLMGYPAAWDSCGATAMRSCRKSRRSS